MISQKFKKFSKNTAGRDFVVGDIHGAFDAVIERMRDVQFNRQNDRLFAVGDLIDRGQDSQRVLNFLSCPYVHSVLGNHDDAFLKLNLSDIRQLGSIDFNGLKWVNKVSDDDLLEIKKLFSRLPVAIEVETARGTVGIVHADVPKGMEWARFIELIEQDDEAALNTALWGRFRLKSHDDTGVPGIDRLFVGHSIQWGGVKRLGNVYHIDSGAIFREIDGDRGFLTMANLTAKTSTLLPSGITGQGSGLFPNSDVGQFGQYAACSFVNA